VTRISIRTVACVHVLVRCAWLARMLRVRCPDPSNSKKLIPFTGRRRFNYASTRTKFFLI